MREEYLSELALRNVASLECSLSKFVPGSESEHRVGKERYADDTTWCLGAPSDAANFPAVWNGTFLVGSVGAICQSPCSRERSAFRPSLVVFWSGVHVIHAGHGAL